MAMILPEAQFGLEYVKRFTEAYKAGSVLDIFTREQLCEDIQFPAVLVSPRKNDLLCGKRVYPEIGYSPQYGGMGYYCRFDLWGHNDKRIKCSLKDREEWRQLETFWQEETTEKKCICQFPSIIKERMPLRFEESPHENAAYYHFRMSGLQLNYQFLVDSGIQGLKELVRPYMNETFDEPFYRGLKGSVKRLEQMILYYKDEVEKLPENEYRKKMIQTLSALLEHPPYSFHEALQLVLLVQTMTGTLNFGRLDTVLGPFLKKDLDEGVLDWDQALIIMQNFYTIIEEEILHFDGRIIVGGKGRENEEAADLLARLAIETTDSLNLPMPQLSLRFYSGQNPDLLEKGFDVLGRGKTFPMIYNDDINIPAVMQSFRIDKKTAEQYIPFGCGEYIIDHQSCGTPNFFINLAMCLELAINGGCALSSGKRWAPDFGSLSDYVSFSELWSAYTKTAEYFLEAGALVQESIYNTVGQECPFSLISLLYDDCLSRGKPIFGGGIRYLGGTNETYGNNNAADSLTAMDELIFKRKQYSGDALLIALKRNWSGYETMHNDFKEAPKFGNDNEVADRRQAEVHRHICQATSAAAGKTSLHHFLVVIINNNFNTIWGKAVSASADGRFFGEALAPGNSAIAGGDRTGMTALLNSMAKTDPSLHAGAVQNVKISPVMPSFHNDLYKALFRGYFKKGGAQIMISVSSRNDLLAALEHPELYGHLMVRVGGFSARFIDLDSDTQKEILSRTEHSV